MAKQPTHPFIDETDQTNAIADSQHIAAGIALPIYQEIQLKNTVLNTDSVKRYLTRAQKIAVMPCSCRTKRKNCDHPVDNCLTLNDAANKFIDRGSAREASVEEALNIVEEAHRAGLVPMAYIRTDTPNPQGVNFICNCCSCSCGTLGVSLKLGKDVHLLKSIATTATDASACTSCGACVDRCHFDARNLADGKLHYNKDLCFGCGLCVTACPTKAITLIQLL
ncbi:MAG: 4Fe-4S binding protein [Candidatus Bathyarchaeota archaeon]